MKKTENLVIKVALLILLIAVMVAFYFPQIAISGELKAGQFVKVHFSFYSAPLDLAEKRITESGSNKAPATQKQIRTTSASIYMSNLDGLIKIARRKAKATGDYFWNLRLADNLLYRSSITGAIGDVDEALALIEQILQQRPQDGSALLLRARVNQSLHAFEEALADLARAQQNGARPEQVASLRLGIETALGKDVLDQLTSKAQRNPGLYSYADLASAYLDRGKFAEADHLYTQAQFLYRDTSPTPLTWLHVQHGIAYLRYGNLERAHDFFTAAHERFPDYYLALEHLALTKAVLGRVQEALVLLLYQEERFARSPGFYSVLAFVEDKLGDREAAALADSKARALYDELLAKHPSAWWQHAAEYFLQRGEIERALELAQKNSELRQDLGSLLLLARAELQVNHLDAACIAWRKVLGIGWNAPEIPRWQSLFEPCKTQPS